MQHFADIFEAIADAVPDAPAIAHGDRVLTWSAYDDHAARLAAAFAGAGLGLDSKVGMYMFNAPEYLVTQYAAFKERITTKVFGPDDREIVPGSGEIGMVAVTGPNIPLGYYKDEEKTARTFRIVDGVRYSFPGDMAMVAGDGTITLLGRGSNCINTAGEKVFPEEVEEVVKTHPAVADCLVFGVDDERFGQRVVGVFSLVSGADTLGDDVIAHARSKLSSYKSPKQLVAVETVPRAPNGKADYKAARALFTV